MQLLKSSEVTPNSSNPRIIKDDKFHKLVQSLKDFPEMANVRPIVVNSDHIILGGNMRYRAMVEAGWKQIPVEVVDWSEDKQREFTIKDNASFGEWDWDVLANEWDSVDLEKWGVDVPDIKSINEKDLLNIEIPFYEPSEVCPQITELASIEKTNALLEKIQALDVDDSLKVILRFRAAFFTDFNFDNVADFYIRQSNEVKSIFESLGLVVLAPKEAIEKGFAELTDYLAEE